MTKLREPNSIEDACRQAAALLGDEPISTALTAKGLRCSPSLIAKWSDPDAPQKPSLEQALSIESLLIKTGNAPIFVELFTRLQPQAAMAVAEELRPLPQAAQIVSGAAELLEQIEKAEADGVVDPYELIGLLAALDRLQKRVAPLRRSLFARVKRAGQKIAVGVEQARLFPPAMRTWTKRQ